MSVVLTGTGVVQPRVVPLGESDGLTVRRTLPTRERSLIGAWCFIDHFGPDPVRANGGMRVAPHPHTGLQTVSWLFTGEVEHRDSAGHHAIIRAGEVNLMTSGRGIAHSEMSTDRLPDLHGVQLWIALPDQDRFVEPRFEHYEPAAFTFGAAEIKVFIGELLGAQSPVKVHTELVGAEIKLAAGETVELPVPTNFEIGILVDHGHLNVDSADVVEGHLFVAKPGSKSLVVRADADTRFLLLGGEPLNEEIVMWWNFIGRSDAEIREFHAQWKAEVDGNATEVLFGWPIDDDHPAEFMPELPAFKLKSRGNR